MKTRMTIPALALVVLALLPSPAQAAQQILFLDPASTEIRFELPATGHNVTGAFVLRSAEILFDDESGLASGEVVVDAASAKTGSTSRDKTMHGKVLESNKFPLFVFSAERLEGSVASTGESKITLVGTLTMHGTAHPFVLPTTVTRDGELLTAETRFEIPFIEWGLADPSIMFLKVDKTVAVTVAAHGRLATSVPSAATSPTATAPGGSR